MPGLISRHLRVSPGHVSLLLHAGYAGPREEAYPVAAMWSGWHGGASVRVWQTTSRGPEAAVGRHRRREPMVSSLSEDNFSSWYRTDAFATRTRSTTRLPRRHADNGSVEAG